MEELSKINQKNQNEKKSAGQDINGDTSYDLENLDDLLKLSKLIEPYLDENENLVRFPDLHKNGILDKNLLASLIKFSAPNRLVQSNEGLNEVIIFLEQLNTQLNDSDLLSTINYFKSMITNFKNAQEYSDSLPDDLSGLDIQETFDAFNKRTKHTIASLAAGTKLNSLVKQTYKAILDKYYNGINNKVLDSHA